MAGMLSSELHYFVVLNKSTINIKIISSSVHLSIAACSIVQFKDENNFLFLAFGSVCLEFSTTCNTRW